MIGARLGSYQIVQALGEGGMGAVYVGEHTVLGRKAAIKVLHPDLARQPETVKRFLQEARSATRVKHSGLVDVIDFGTDEWGNAFLVMELLDGESLGSRLRRDTGPPVEWTVRILRQIAVALEAVHQVGIVHRDLKPENVFLVHDDAVVGGERVKVLDFGLAKASLGSERPNASNVKTRTGAVMGTPLYMSPEQCRGAGMPIDLRSDVYSLGCILFEMLSGRPPFVAEGMGDLLVSHIHDEPPSPAAFGRDVPDGLARLALWMLRKQPGERPQTMRAVIDALDAFSGGRSVVPPGVVAAPTNPVPVAVGSGALPMQMAGQSTLAGAASQMAGRRSAAGRGWLLAAGVVALAAVAIVGVVLFSNDDDQRAATAEPPAPSPAEVTGPAPSAPPSPSSTPSPSPPEPKQPAMVTLSIDSQPQGATVHRKLDGVTVGVTPLKLSLERARGNVTYVVTMDGFKPQDLTMPVDVSSAVKLELVANKKKRQQTDVTPVPRRPIKDGAVDPYSP